MEEDRTVFLTFANALNLLNSFRAVGSGYVVQLHCDVTFKASKAALNKLGFGVNMLESHFAYSQGCCVIHQSGCQARTWV